MPKYIANAVVERSEGICECLSPGKCIGPAQHIHHRKLRSQGGAHSVVNCIMVCHVCHHQVIHGNPRQAYENGWLVHGWDDPEDEPVLRRGRWVLLHEDGTTTEVEKNEGIERADAAGGTSD